MTKDHRLNSDQLVERGRDLHKRGHLVVFLYPSQEWMAVELQIPFLRYQRMLPRVV
jgi:hypothetical protein